MQGIVWGALGAEENDDLEKWKADLRTINEPEGLIFHFDASDLLR